jgi:hypothetical protein
VDAADQDDEGPEEQLDKIEGAALSRGQQKCDPDDAPAARVSTPSPRVPATLKKPTSSQGKKAAMMLMTAQAATQITPPDHFLVEADAAGTAADAVGVFGTPIWCPHFGQNPSVSSPKDCPQLTQKPPAVVVVVVAAAVGCNSALPAPQLEQRLLSP